MPPSRHAGLPRGEEGSSHEVDEKKTEYSRQHSGQGRAEACLCVSGGAKANLRRVADYGLRGSLTFHRSKVFATRVAMERANDSARSLGATLRGDRLASICSGQA